MKQLIYFAIPLLLAVAFSACSESKKAVSDDEWFIPDTTVTDTTVTDSDALITDEIVTETDATGDKDDLFAEGPLSDDSPMASDEDGVLPDEGTDETSDETVDEDAPVTPDTPPADIDIVPGTCAEGLFRLTASVFYRVGNQNITGGGTIAFDPVGTADSEGNLACYAPNTTVTMTLTVDEGQSFIAWRGPDAGDVQGDFPTFTILMDADKSVRAQVTPPESVDVDIVSDVDVVVETCPSGYKLAPYVYYQQGPQQIIGGGEIAMDPVGSLSSAGNPVCYAPNTTVNMTVTVYEGYTWDQWRGADRFDVQGTFPNFWIVVDSDKDVRARVTPN